MKRRSIFFLLIVLCTQIQQVISQVSEKGVPPSFQLASPLPFSIIKLPAIDKTALDVEDKVNDQNKSNPYRFGYNHYVNYNFSNAGIWHTLPNGDRLWQTTIQCPNAISINTTFSNYHLPTGAKLFIYNKDKTEVLGAFTSKNNTKHQSLGTTLISGSQITIEYYEPANVAFAGTFTIWRITHGYRGLADYLLKSYGDAGSCNVNINCPEGADWEYDKKSVACIIVGGNEQCTGALINNALNDGTPYFLTADHCYDNDVNTWVFRFNWESSSCVNQNGPINETVAGAQLMARSSTSDFCLLKLDDAPQDYYEVYYAGWNRDTLRADSATAIHHPSGDIKKISKAANQMISESEGFWRVGQWTLGVTEPGSSGSPLFNPQHQIIGQLWGGPSRCAAPPQDLNDTYGKIQRSWEGDSLPSSRLKDWLDPNGSNTIAIAGSDPTIITDSIDASVKNIISPTYQVYCDGTIKPEIIIKNRGLDTLHTLNAYCSINNGALLPYNWTGNLATNEVDTIIFTTINVSTTGTHSFKTYVTNPNGKQDQKTVNDTLSNTFYIDTAYTLPHKQDFEAATTLTNGWEIINKDGWETWQLDTLGAYGQSSSSIVFDNYSSNHIGEEDFLTSPLLKTNTSYALYIKFDYAYAPYSSTYKDSLIIYLSDDCGITKKRLWAKGYLSLATTQDSAAITTYQFKPHANEWKTDSILLNPYITNSDIIISFANRCGYGQDIYLDNINIYTDTLATNISTIEQKTQLNLYPNPTNETLYINTNTTGIALITNVMGQILFRLPINSNTIYKLDVQDFTNGIYFINFNNKVTQKFIISK